MRDNKLMDASCRVALAALLHDLGKFAERARIEEAEEKDAQGITRKAVNIQLYCPHFDGRPSHIHAAYTAMGAALLDLLNSLEMRGSLTGCETHHSPFFLTIFSSPRRLGWDKKVAEGTVSGARRSA